MEDEKSSKSNAAGRSTATAADGQSSESIAAGPSNAAGLSPGFVFKNVTTAYALDDGVSKSAESVAKNNIRSDNLCESTGQISVTRPEKKGNLKMMRTMKQVNTVIPVTEYHLVTLMINIKRLLLERMKMVLESMLM
jgi:hypothetical protein